MLLRRIVILLAALQFWGGDLVAQKEHAHWYFGTAGLDFNMGNPVALVNSAMNQNESVATVSDSAGRMLFYTDGIQVWDSTHAQMPNGFGLSGNSSTTQCLIAPLPMSDSIYYLFTQAPQGNSAGMQYNIIDMSLNNGRGDVTLKNQLLYSASTERVCAIPHPNGIDIWIVSHEWNSDVFRTHRLTCNGLIPGPSSSAGTLLFGNVANAAGYLRPSHKGDKLAMAIPGINTIEVFDFDRSTGMVAPNPLSIPTVTTPYGLEYSPNDSLLYASEGVFSNPILWQFDMSAGNNAAIINSAIPLDTTASMFLAGALQLAPDGKIYYSKMPQTYLNRIEFPDSAGIACSFADSAMSLTGQFPGLGLPHNYEFIGRPWLDSARYAWTTVCLGDTTWFQDASDYLPDSTYWTFGDPMSGADDTSTLLNPFHVFSGSGVFAVTRITYRSCLSDTVTELVEVFSLPQVNLGTDTTVCDQSSLLLMGPPGNTYLWSTGDLTQSITATAPGIYWLQADNGTCSSRDSITVNFSTSPIVDIGPDTTFNCPPVFLVLDAGNPTATFLWSTGTPTQKLMATQTGTYWVSVTLNGCTTTDTIEVSLGTLPVLDIGGRDTICEGDSITLDAGGGWDVVRWTTGDSSSSITVSQFGMYIVTATIGVCPQKDTMQIFWHPRLELSLPSQPQALCDGLQDTLDAGSLPDNYLWSTGDTTQVIVIDSAGTYSVTVGNQCETLRDSVLFVQLDAPSPNLGADLQLCREEEALLFWTPTFPEFTHSYAWSTGDSGQTLLIDQTGFYWLEVANACGTGSDTIEVSRNDENSLFIPNVFTPNGDGIIDMFRVETTDPEYFQLQVYDRWGRQMYSADHPNSGWDGTFNGTPAAEGTYYFRINVRDCNGELMEKAGVLTLLR